MDWGTLLAILIPALLGGSGLGAVIATNIANRRKVKAESDKIAAECMAILGETFKSQIAGLTARIDSLQAESDRDKRTSEAAIENRDRKIDELEKQVRKLTADLEISGKRNKEQEKRIQEQDHQIAVMALELERLRLEVKRLIGGGCGDQT